MSNSPLLNIMKQAASDRRSFLIRRDAMNGFTIKMRSFTQAEKARSFLAKQGISSLVQRTSGRGGCAFALIVTRSGGMSKNEVCRLLLQIGVDCDIS